MLKAMLLASAVIAAPVGAQTTPPDAAPAVAEAVESAFPAHDLNGDGTLSRAEFSVWMAKLKARSEAAARSPTPATRAWVEGAWVKADADRNAAVTAAELTGFLTQGRG